MGAAVTPAVAVAALVLVGAVAARALPAATETTCPTNQLGPTSPTMGAEAT